ncbi:MAG: hypothetical protein D6731_18605 [Planctomycetota bacterium]|nr:MAG: hypothetical protein D6731_18605 [Planctomycetota bacterium]
MARGSGVVDRPEARGGLRRSAGPGALSARPRPARPRRSRPAASWGLGGLLRARASRPRRIEIDLRSGEWIGVRNGPPRLTVVPGRAPGRRPSATQARAKRSSRWARLRAPRGPDDGLPGRPAAPRAVAPGLRPAAWVAAGGGAAVACAGALFGWEALVTSLVYWVFYLLLLGLFLSAPEAAPATPSGGTAEASALARRHASLPALEAEELLPGSTPRRRRAA